MADDLSERLEKAQSDGTITAHDADEVRHFVAFLGDLPPKAERESTDGRRRCFEVWRDYYPEDATLAIKEHELRITTRPDEENTHA